MKDILRELERALGDWNPLLASALKPGLREPQIRRHLNKHGFTPQSGDVVDLYQWRDGTPLTPAVVAGKRGMFPSKTPYYLLDLAMAIASLDHVRAASEHHPKLSRGRDFLPLFWDGSKRWIVLEGLPGGGKVLAADHDSAQPFREIDPSLGAFMERAVRAIESRTDISF
jgi:hypothetical protein